ncbi:MAG: sensor domain-containing diguanylate cyclase [Candidatus Rifleibacteriota bacterium]
MKEKLLIALTHTLKGYLTEPNATRLIQKAFKTIEQQLQATRGFIALQNKQTSYLDISHSFGVSRSAMNNFHRKIGSNTIGRLFFKESFNIIKPGDPHDDYLEMKIDNDYAMCVTAHIGWEGRTFGFLACYFDREFEIDQGHRNFLLAMAGAISASLEKQHLLSLISELKQFDVETGIYTHQFFISRLEKEIEICLETEKPLSLVIMDMENFKSIINLYGNEIAHQVLKDSAEELKSHIRGCDVLGSLGVAEFVLFMPDTRISQAEKIIKTFKHKLLNLELTQQRIKASFSFGLTELNSEDDLESFIHRAQLALYNARKSGEGTISIAD